MLEPGCCRAVMVASASLSASAESALSAEVTRCFRDPIFCRRMENQASLSGSSGEGG